MTGSESDKEKRTELINLMKRKFTRYVVKDFEIDSMVVMKGCSPVILFPYRLEDEGDIFIPVRQYDEWIKLQSLFMIPSYVLVFDYNISLFIKVFSNENDVRYTVKDRHYTIPRSDFVEVQTLSKEFVDTIDNISYTVVSWRKNPFKN